GCGGDGRNTAHPVLDGSTPDRLFIEPARPPQRRIDDQVHSVALDQIERIRPALVHFVYLIHLKSALAQRLGSAPRRHKTESQACQLACQYSALHFVLTVEREEN